MATSRKIYAIPMGDQVLKISVNQFDEDSELDIEQLLKIDYSRLKAESVTFPVVLNRLGLMLADAENKLKNAQLDFEIWEAGFKSDIREDLLARKKEEKMTDEDIKARMYSALYANATFKVKKKQILKAEHDKTVLSAFFWNAKDKSEKINVLLDKAQPDDIQLEELGNSINGINFKLVKPAMS